MLVLTRKTDQSILIGDEIEIRIVQVKGTGSAAQVRIGIVAPKGVRILRKEVLEAVREENLRAAQRGASVPSPDALLSLLPQPQAPAEAPPPDPAASHPLTPVPDRDSDPA